MYESLKRYTLEFHLFILAFDDKCERILKQLRLENVTIISLKDFEDEELKKVKTTRSRKEYFWTCTPSLIKYCIEKYNLELCTYLDADIYFYDNPEVLTKEMDKDSIMISPHRYTSFYDQSTTSGIYCVQFVTFKNDQNGMKALEWWRKACNAWCYDKLEVGKFGDQKYLDNWPESFNGVHIMKHLGGGVAPWNVQQYDFYQQEDGKFLLKEKKTKKVFPIIFYHYHNLRFRKEDKIDLGPYFLPNWVINWLYKPYVTHLIQIGEKLEKLEKGDYHSPISLEKNWKKRLISIFVKMNVMKRTFFYFFNNHEKILFLFREKRNLRWLLFFIRLLTRQDNVYNLKDFYIRKN